MMRTQIGGLQSELDEVVALCEVSKKELAAANIQIVRLANENLAETAKLAVLQEANKAELELMSHEKQKEAALLQDRLTLIIEERSCDA